MAAKRWLVLNGLEYPTNPNAPREQWTWAAAPQGAVVDDIPEVSLPWLIEQGEISPAGESREALPEDFPAREALAGAGYKTVGQVETHADELLDIEGIGPKTHEDIRAALVLLARTVPVASGEG